MSVISPISPLPFYSFSQDAPVGVSTPFSVQPFSNTKEVLVLNRSGTATALIQVANLQSLPALGYMMVGCPQDGVNVNLAPWSAADEFSVDGQTLTAHAYPGSGARPLNTFWVDQRAQAQVEVNAPAIPDPERLLKIFALGEEFILIPVGGPRTPGTLEYTIGANALQQFNFLFAMFNDPTTLLRTKEIIEAPVSPAPGSIVLTAGAALRGSDGNSPMRQKPGDPGNFVGISVDMQQSWGASDGFKEGVDVPYSISLPNKAILKNTPLNYLYSILDAMADPANAIFSVATGRQALEPFPATTVTCADPVGLEILSKPANALGNGYIVAENTGGLRLQATTTPTAGGVDMDLPVISQTDSLVLPPGAAITLGIGPEGNRNPLGLPSRWSADPGSNLGLVIQAESDEEFVVNVTYVNNVGYPEGE